MIETGSFRTNMRVTDVLVDQRTPRDASEYVHISEPEYRAWQTSSTSEPLHKRGDQVRIPMTTELHAKIGWI